jgi:divalent metal cation (Fe/Co/Zn/Cd) transporter
LNKLPKKIAKKAKGVHNVAKVTADKPVGGLAPLRINFVITIKQNFSANEVSTEIGNEVKKYLKEMCDIVDVTVDIRITGVEQIEKKRRVR